jgi:phytoene dehydrogenase-like protein
VVSETQSHAAGSTVTTTGPDIRSEPARDEYDAVVIGSGPNGLTCAITLARAGQTVLVVEAGSTIGGGTRSNELTQPGFIHDVCSAVHPLGVCSPVFKGLPLEEHGLTWIYPEASVVHAFEIDRPVVVYPSIDRTVAELGRDGGSYRRLLAPFLENQQRLLAGILAPFSLFPPSPVTMLRFGLRGLPSATSLARRWLVEPETAGMFAGLAAHAILPLEKPLTGAVGLMFAVMAHVIAWPIARGGSQQIAQAMARYLNSLGGEIVVGKRVASLGGVPKARAYFFDTVARDVARIAGERLPNSYRERLSRVRHGPAVFKVDWALDGPVPWRHPGFAKAATVHIGGTIEEIAEAERAAWEGHCTEKPFVLFAQQSLFDGTRAPAGKHTGWGYCHVPAGSTEDMTERIEKRIESFAPGFRDRILARHVMPPHAMEQYNANYVGGDITGGVMDIGQMFTRPVNLLSPYSTPARDIFICSSSTPPGPGVHGMCGYFAATAALRSAPRT